MRAHERLIQQECTSCHATISFGRVASGKKVRCPKCRKLINPVVTQEREQLPVIETPDIDMVQFELKKTSLGTELNPTSQHYLNESQTKKLLQHLNCENSEHHITIRVAEDNPDALPFAEFLKGLFMMAGWQTTGIDRAVNHTRQRDALTLYAGTWPFPPEVTMTCMALTASGLKFSSHMDPNQIRESAVLVVNSKPGKQ
jgi:hypothetical protein